MVNYHTHFVREMGDLPLHSCIGPPSSPRANISSQHSLYDQYNRNNFYCIRTENTFEDRILCYEYLLISLIHGHVWYLSEIPQIHFMGTFNVVYCLGPKLMAVSLNSMAVIYCIPTARLIYFGYTLISPVYLYVWRLPLGASVRCWPGGWSGRWDGSPLTALPQWLPH